MEIETNILADMVKAYADDIVLIAGTPERLQQAVVEWHEELTRN